MDEGKLDTINTCKNCGNKFTGRFCNICGEKVYSRKDKKVWNLISEVTHFITHFEGTIFNTLRVLFTRPGQLSEDYCNGIRKKYFKPVSFFLLLVVIYLLFPVFEGLNQNLFYHMHNPMYGEFATQKIQNLEKVSGLTIEQISSNFHRKGEKVSKFLLFLLLPVSALFLKLFLFRKNRLFFDHFIFATEINIIFLLWGFLLFPLILVVIEFFYNLFYGSYLNVTDAMTGILMYLAVSTYIAIAAKIFYSLKLWQAILLSLIFLLFYFLFIMIVYKFILFMLVFWQIT